MVSRIFLKFVSLGPPYGYQELIIMTLLKSENKMGTLQEIYEKIMEDFSYFRYATSDRNWKKKIREELNNTCKHNLKTRIGHTFQGKTT